MSVVFLQGNSRDMLRQLPPEFFHCCVTSPPYFGLRKYDGGEEDWGGDDGCSHEWSDNPSISRGNPGNMSTLAGTQTADLSKVVSGHGYTCIKCGAWRGQLGGEPTSDLYVRHLVEICQGIKRVLRPDGVFWLNIGDSWSASSNSPRVPSKSKKLGQGTQLQQDASSRHRDPNCKPLDMILVPSLLALALRADGWYIRSQIIWSKQNPMPESVNGWRWERHKVKDGDDYQECPGCDKCNPNDGYVLRKGSWRPTDSFEVIWMLTKTRSYYCDRESVMEPNANPYRKNYRPGKEAYSEGNVHDSSGRVRRNDGFAAYANGKICVGRNLRSVWDFPTQPFHGAHFAVFPPRLPELCIKSSTSEGGCCPKCGAPYARVVEKCQVPHDGETECKNTDNNGNTRRLALMRQAARERGSEYTNSVITSGWKPTCLCGRSESVPCRVIDPFSGAGTTAIVADILGRVGFGIDTSEKYVELSKERFSSDREKIVKSLSRNNWKGY